MHQTYCNIFERIGLDYRPVLADTGSIGGSGSHEFHVLADSGEDDIAFSTESDFAANVELAEALAPTETADEATLTMEEVRHTRAALHRRSEQLLKRTGGKNGKNLGCTR